MDEANVVDFLVKLPTLLDAAIVQALQATPTFGSFVAEMERCIDIAALPAEMQSLLFYHTLVLNTIM